MTTKTLPLALRGLTGRWALGLAILTAFSVPSVLHAYGRDADSGLVFDVSELAWSEPLDAAVYHGVKTALLVHPDDAPERQHHSNSNMASVAVHDVAEGGGARPHPVEGFREQVFIVLEGKARFTIGGQVFEAQAQDIIFAPPGLPRGFTASGGAPAKIVQAEWVQPGPPPSEQGRPLQTSEQKRPLVRLGGEGYVTVESNARQQGDALSIVGFGAGHINFSNSLLLYHLDLPAPRNFTANTRLARMGLSQYQPGGGTRWHFHPDREQVFIILGGTGLVEIGANTRQVQPGIILFAPRHVGHAYKTVGEEPFKFLELEWGR